ncbi:MAG UNVERIFIED_CONTAM: hypothetical protein LVR18_17555 [Planctomycetaceae bacterium]|jgi:mono/diheme cytochrome c family protein
MNPMLLTIPAIFWLATVAVSEPPTSPQPDFTAAREAGRAKSMLARRDASAPTATTPTAPVADLAGYQQRIAPLLQRSCVPCHGPDTVEGNLRIDTLNPNLLTGPDIAWWLEVSSVIARGEMPPPDAETLTEADRAAIVDWLATQLRAASEVQRAAHSGSAFRRLSALRNQLCSSGSAWPAVQFCLETFRRNRFQKTAFETALSFCRCLPASSRFCRESFLQALKRVTVRGERPALLYWGCAMHAASADEWTRIEQLQQKLREEHAADPAALERALTEFHSQHSRRHGGPYYLDPATGLTEGIQWGYGGAQYAWPPQSTAPAAPQIGGRTAIVPAGRKLTVELGDQLPDSGPLLVRVRACSPPGR